MTDEWLVSLAKDGDEGAWRVLLDRHRGCLMHSVHQAHRHYHKDFDDAESQAHLAFVNAVHKYDASRGVAFITLLWKVVRNAVINADDVSPFYVPNKSRRTREGVPEFSRGFPGEHASRDNTLDVDLEDDLESMHKAMANLDTRTRGLLTSMAEGRSCGEDGEAFGLTKQGVWEARKRAIEKLRFAMGVSP